MKQKIAIIAVMTLLVYFSLPTLQAQKKAEKTFTRITHQQQGMSVVNNQNGDSSVQLINCFQDGQSYQIKTVNDKLVELTVDGKKIPATEFSHYNSAIKKIREQIRKESETAEMDRKQADADEKQAEIDLRESEKDREQAEADEKTMEQDRKQAELDREEAKRDEQQALEDQEQAKRDLQQAEEDRKQAALDRVQSEKDRELMKSLTADLIKAQIIKSEKDLYSLVLKKGSLLVNDEKQSADLYNRFNLKYLKDSRSEIRFSNTANHRGLSVYSSDATQQ